MLNRTLKIIFVGLLTTLLVVVVAVAVSVNAATEPKPEQVHISLGTDESEMIVTWTTIQKTTGHPVVHYGQDKTKLTHTSQAEITPFEHNIFTYRALMTGLHPGTVYYYQVGTGSGSMSKVYKFRTLKSGHDWNPRFAIYGDFGYQNDKSLPYLTKEVEKDDFDTIFHIGDFAYDLNERNGQQGNDFMNSIEPVAARVPYMTCPGNHESASNFSHYDARFTMIGDRHQPNHKAPLTQRMNNHFWSVDIGPAHFLLFSTEYYYYTNYGWEQIKRQFQFLEEDLKRANANRVQRPWIIAMGHRPLYCLKIGDTSCDHQTLERADIRQGIHMHGDMPGPGRQYGLEDLFFKYGVDLQFYGHEHFYARLLPIYNNEIKKRKNAKNPYDHPAGPMHITTGSAGNRENHPPFNHLKEWVAFHKADYGYTRMHFLNQSHIVVEQISDDQHGAVIDKVEIIKHDAKPHWMP